MLADRELAGYRVVASAFGAFQDRRLYFGPDFFIVAYECLVADQSGRSVLPKPALPAYPLEKLAPGRGGDFVGDYLHAVLFLKDRIELVHLLVAVRAAGIVEEMDERRIH